jgi:Lambda phage tail tube protein, TTP
MANVTDTFYAGEAIVGYGAQLLVGQDDGSPETFVAVADVMSIQMGAMTTAVVDKTHLRSPEAHREKVATLRDSAAMTITGNWRPEHGSHANAGGDGFANGGLVALWRTRAERNFIIQLPRAGSPAITGSPGMEVPFRGVVTNFTPGAIGLDDKVGFTAEITPLQDFSAAWP